MAPETLVNTIIELAASTLQYMLPVIGVMAGLTFIFSWIHAITLGSTRKIFRD